MTSPVPENLEKETRPHPPKDYIPPIIVCKDCKRVGYSVAHFMDPSLCKCGSTNILESRSEAGAKYIGYPYFVIDVHNSTRALIV